MGAGTAFGLGTLLNPRQQIQVLDNGISALNCLEDRSRTVFIAIAPIEDLLRPLDQAIANLRQQIATQVASADKRADARKLYSAALVQRAAKAPSMVGLVQRITAGTDQIITETNTQLKRAEPDVNAVQRIAASINLAKSPTVLTSVGPPSPPPRGEMFAQKEVLLPGDRALDNAMTAVWNELPVLDAVAALQPPSADTLNSCKMAATTGVAMALSPATDAAPKKGAPWTITSTVAGFGSWEGPTPPDIKAAPLNTASKTFVFTTNSTNLTSPAYRFVVRSAIDDANAAAINVSIGK
jgi:hypothetical protein